MSFAGLGKTAVAIQTMNWFVMCSGVCTTDMVNRTEKGDSMIYQRARYNADNGTAIMALTDNREPYAHISVCLADYGVSLPENQIVINHVLLNSPDFMEKIRQDLIKKEVMSINFGFSESIIVELKDNWKEICEEV